jgi:PAS domain S-box-containing protein
MNLLRTAAYILIALWMAVWISRGETAERSRMQDTVEQAAVNVSDAMWKLDRESPTAYLQQILMHNRFRTLTITRGNDSEFLNFSKTHRYSILEIIFAHPPLTPIASYSADVTHKGKVIGHITATVSPGTAHQHAITLAFGLLLAFAVSLYFRMVDANRRLDERVRERTAELEESQERFTLFSNNVTEVLWSLDRNLNPTYYSPSVESQRGWTPEEALAMGLKGLLPSESLPLLKEAINSYRGKTSTPEPIDIKMLHKDGSAFWGRLTFTVLRDSSGAVEGVVGITTDVTELRQAEAGFREEKAFNDAVLRSLPGIFFVYDETKHLIRWNRNFEVFTGYSGYEMLGRYLESWVVEEDLAAINENLEHLANNNSDVVTVEARIINKDRSTTSYLFSASQLESNGKQLTVGIGIDISGIKTLERQLSQAQKMEAIGTLAGGIAHDFNNILSAISGFTELALLDAKGNEQVTSSLNHVVEAGNRANSLVSQILAFSRQTQEEIKPVMIKYLASEALQLLRASLPTTIKIDKHLHSDSTVLADPTQIHQIVMNLCTNAGYAMKASGGVLTVRLDDVELSDDFIRAYPRMSPGTHLRLTVQDTGEGIAPTIIGRVFDPFFSTKKQGEGTGLGLSVIHSIITKYNGCITVESVLDIGTTFSVYLPTATQLVEATQLKPAAASMGTERILFVDDEPLQAELVEKGLGRLGYSVTTMTDSLEALSLLEKSPDDFDLLITDMTMPNMTGDLLAKRVMMIRKELPIIICTGYRE